MCNILNVVDKVPTVEYIEWVNKKNWKGKETDFKVLDKVYCWGMELKSGLLGDRLTILIFNVFSMQSVGTFKYQTRAIDFDSL